MRGNGDHELARELAWAAGQRLLALRERLDEPGTDPADVRCDGDRSSHEFLTRELAQARPGDAVLSEEGKDDPARLSASRVWIVDPLDGTREFGERGRADWAVHVALWEAGRGLTAGAVALPAQDRVLSTPQPSAVCAVDEDGAGKLPTGLRIVVSRSRPPEFVTALAERIGAQLVPLGSAGAKAAEVIRGEVDVYVHGGGQYEWDSAAPVAVAWSAGLHASRIDGSELVYNQRDPWLADILICPARLAPGLLAAISSVVPEIRASVN